MCSGIELDSSLLAQIENLRDTLRAGTQDCRPAVIHTLLDSIIEGIHHNLDHRMFMYVPAKDSSYWDNVRLFGDDFLVVFPVDAVMEMCEIGNCFVASRGAACVFHCMRVAEYGLRQLAQLVRVKLSDNGKPVPVEFATWDKVIQGVRAKITETRRLAHGRRKERTLRFYSDAADHCEYMKDIWRNEIAHARRRSYTRDETLGVIVRVRDFAQLLARHEIPNDPKKHLDKLNRRLEQLRLSHGDIVDEHKAETKDKHGDDERVRGVQSDDAGTDEGSAQ